LLPIFICGYNWRAIAGLGRNLGVVWGYRQKVAHAKSMNSFLVAALTESIKRYAYPPKTFDFVEEHEKTLGTMRDVDQNLNNLLLQDILPLSLPVLLRHSLPLERERPVFAQPSECTRRRWWSTCIIRQAAAKS
jgi:hypothetical protein